MASFSDKSRYFYADKKTSYYSSNTLSSEWIEPIKGPDKKKVSISLIGSLSGIESIIPSTLCSIDEENIWGIVIFPISNVMSGASSWDQSIWYKFETINLSKNQSKNLLKNLSKTPSKIGIYKKITRITDIMSEPSLDRKDEPLLKPQYLCNEVYPILKKNIVFNETDCILCVAYTKKNSNEFNDFQFGISGTRKIRNLTGRNPEIEHPLTASIREIKEETGITISTLEELPCINISDRFSTHLSIFFRKV